MVDYSVYEDFISSTPWIVNYRIIGSSPILVGIFICSLKLSSVTSIVMIGFMLSSFMMF